MHTKPISTEVIASYEATLISGVAPLTLEMVKGAFNVDTDEYVYSRSFCMDDNDTFQELLAYRRALVDILNIEDVGPDKCAYTLFDEFTAIPRKINEGNDKKECASMHTLFDAVVAYRLIRHCFYLTEGMTDVLREQIYQQLSDNKRFHLGLYFTNIKRHDEMNSIGDGDYAQIELKHNDVDMLGYEEAFKLLRSTSIDGTSSFFDKVSHLKDFPAGLLPPNRDDQDPSITRFQEVIDDIDKHQKSDLPSPSIYRGMQLDLLPVLFIIAKVNRGPEDKPGEGRPMNEHERHDLITYLSAAKAFYGTLCEAEKANVEGMKPSQLILNSIEDVLGSIERKDCDCEDPKGRDIFKFLYKFHLLDKSFQAISACSRLFGLREGSDEHGKYLAQANDLINFCDAFKHHSSLSEPSSKEQEEEDRHQDLLDSIKTFLAPGKRSSSELFCPTT